MQERNIRKRCPWAKTAVEIAYHDFEWCRPVHDERKLFEMLILEGMQAGVSWYIILQKRPAFLAAFDNFEPKAVASYTEEKVEELMENPAIIRNRNKINSAIGNARAFLRIQEELGSFDAYIWSFTGGKTIQNHLQEVSDMPAKTELSERISADLKKRGFKFVGPVIIYSYMQAIGMVNDHVEWCDCYNEGGKL